MTDDERIDEIIRTTAASEYNRPPAVPRDEMWNAIQAARQAAPPGPRLHVTAGGASRSAPLGGYSAAQRSAPRYMWFALAAAAVFLVATGVGIGRWTSRGASDAGQRQIADQPSNVPSTITGDGIPTPQTPPDAAPSGASSAPSRTAPPATEAGQPSRTAQPAAAPRTREDIRRSPQVVGTRPLTRLATAGADTPPQTQLDAVTYQVAAQQHLQDAEALLTSFSVESRDERMNTQFAGWAKGLLSNTRLLLDSPAGEDPRRAKLLQDLELVLAQLVQLSPNAAAQERELIQGSIEDGHVMTRLRTAIPAAQPREITER